MNFRSRRRRIFFGVEGESERSFARWVESLCNEFGTDVKFDIRVCGGGDSLAVVQYSLSEYSKRKLQYGKYSRAFILLDQDRIEQDQAVGRNPTTALKESSMQIIWQRPNLEGLLLRLHDGMEQNFVAAEDARVRLRKLWPKYEKNVNVMKLQARFSISDLRRVAKYDKEIEKLLTMLWLI